MYVCFTSDLHGREYLYAQLGELVLRERPDLLILGGDLFRDGDIDDPVATQVDYIKQDFLPRLAGWHARLPALQIACILGNHDWLCAQRVLTEYSNGVRLVLLDVDHAHSYGGTDWLGYSKTPPTPYWVKDFERLDLPDDPVPPTGGAVWDPVRQWVCKAEPAEHFRPETAIARELAGVSPPRRPWIFVCHAPPYDTRLDRLPHVDHPIGSRAVRSFIEQHRPLCALHGHIHESPEVTGGYTERIGDTLCINPGQGVHRLHAVLFDMERPEATLRHTIFP